MKTYEFKNSGTGDINIVYYDENGVEETVEYYSKEDGSGALQIREGYILKQN